MHFDGGSIFCFIFRSNTFLVNPVFVSRNILFQLSVSREVFRGMHRNHRRFGLIIGHMFEHSFSTVLAEI